jgi:GntR family transcriptional regulator
LGVVVAIDPTSDRPVFKQIADHLRAAIQSGELEPGERMPSEQVLIDAHGVARGTIRQAMNLLRSEGLVRTEHGRGSFVRDRPPVRRLAHDRFARRHRERGRAAYLAELEAEGRVAEVEVLEVGRVKAPDDVAVWLQLAMGADVLVRRRRYLADGEPMELATSYVSWELAEGTQMTQRETGPGGIYARLEERGHRLKRFSEEVSARMPTVDEIRALRLQPGVPVIRVVRVAYDIGELPVEACDTVMAADRYVLSYELPAR